MPTVLRFLGWSPDAVPNSEQGACYKTWASVEGDRIPVLDGIFLSELLYHLSMSMRAEEEGIGIGPGEAGAPGWSTKD